MTANFSSEHDIKFKLSRACLFFQERTVRCLLLLSVLCLAGCEGNKSESPCALSLLGHGRVVWKGKGKPSPDPCSHSSFRALLRLPRRNKRTGLSEAGTGVQEPAKQAETAGCPPQP